MIKKALRGKKGITLVALVITIIAFLIIVGVSILLLTSDNGIIKKASEAKTNSEIIEIKEKIILDIYNEQVANNGKYPSNDIIKSILEKDGTVIYGEDGTTVKGVITSDRGYRILLADIGRLNSSSVVDINYEIKNISGNTYNILVKINSNNGIEKVVYKNNVGTDVTLFCDSKLEVNIDYQVNPNTDYYFIVKEVGQAERIEKIFIQPEKTILADGTWNGTVNSPKLLTGMTGIYWDDSGNEVLVTADNQENWYDYGNKKWANAKTQDGSYFVWIPRYEYKIPTLHTSTAQTIDVNFKQDTNIQVTSGYTMHPAFTFGTTEIPGIWVAKFEAGGSASAIDIKPNVTSLRGITIGEMFTACRNMETNERYGWDSSGIGIDTHLMKNIEWGACAYLSSSKYGKTGEIWRNPNSNFITGQAGTSVNASTTTITYSYNDTTYGVNSSTTGNIYGIYDMNGGTSECTAAYVDNGYSALRTYGASLIDAEAKYKDVYVSSGDSLAGNYAAASNKKGDALYETSSNGNSGTGAWYGDWSYFSESIRCFFQRGLSYQFGVYTGAFSFDGCYGFSNYNYGFRSIIIGV